MRTGDGAGLHVRELALFLSVHRDRAPGLLWSEHDHPACRPWAAQSVIDLMAVELAGLVGARVSAVRGDGAARRVRGGPDVAHTLVRQNAGGGTWTLMPGPWGAVTEPFHCRLLADEVLYVPPGCGWSADQSAGARYLLIRIDDAG
ncbi:hypothetical protein BX265_8427 [Streptomyces sp. TLI_235]|nr:hypothetical protein [Streptomyces sp. TLI_235]PBC66212.1 hypothetical protein BX265_8427 [Streptomyces sp. TLI_235]